MRKVFAFVLILIGFLPPSAAQTDCSTGGQTAFASETLAISTTAVILTASVYNPGAGQPNATSALVVVNPSENLRVAFDGSAPTTSVGAVVVPNQSFVICGVQIAKFQAIRDGASDGEITATYFSPAQ